MAAIWLRLRFQASAGALGFDVAVRQALARFGQLGFDVRSSCVPEGRRLFLLSATCA